MIINNYVIFIILITISIIYLFIHYKNREGLAFGLPYMEDSYKRLGVVRDKENKIMYLGDKTFNYSARINNRYAADIANSKVKSTALLRKNSVPVADSVVWKSNQPIQYNVDLVERKLGYPVVVKPVHGQKGYGVTAGILSKEELIEAVQPLIDEEKPILIDKHLDGEEYRIMVYNGDIVGVTMRSKPKVIGDGVHNINQLIDTFNDNKKTSYKCHNINKRLIQKQGFKMSDTPSTGKEVIISNIANMSNGGGIDDVEINMIHPDNIVMFKKAAQVSNLKLTGMDFITPSMLIPYYKMPGECGILELNNRPGMGVHYYAKGDNRDDFIDGFIKGLFNYNYHELNKSHMMNTL